MLKTNKIQTLVINNPFDRSDVKRVELDAEGKTLTALFAEVEAECVVAVNGRIIDEQKWDEVIPMAGDALAISVVPTGGENGKSILRIAAIVALSYFTFGAGATFFTAANFGSAGMAYAAASVAFIGGSMLINKILPPTMPELPDQSLAASPSQTYGIDGAKNTSRENIPVPLCFGGYNMAANYINTRTINQGQQQRLFLLINAGEGEVQGLSNIRINGESYESFDATVVTRNGAAEQDVIEDFTDASFDTNVSQVLEEAGDDVTFTTSTPSSSIEVDIVFQQGLYKLNTRDGSYASSTVNIIAGYRKRGSDSNIWHSLKEEKSTACVRAVFMNKSRSRALQAGFVRLDRLAFHQGVNQDLERFDSFIAPLNEVFQERDDEYGSVEDYWETYELIGVLPNGQEENLGIYANESLSHNRINTGSALRGRSPEALRFTLRSPTVDLDNYEVFVERLTEKPDNEDPDRVFTTSNAMTVTNFRQYRGVDGIAYNNTALIGVSVTVDNQINSMPTITYFNEGMLIPVYYRDPDNPSKFKYNMRPSSNPAWIVHAMYTNKRWGAGKPPSALVMEEFYEWAKLCEENGWHFRGVFDSQMNIFDAAKAVAKIGHARIVPIGTQYGVNVQHKQQMTQLFTSSMMVKDSFEMSWLPTTDRANVIDCTFYDAENFNKPRTFRYYNENLIEKGHPFRPAELTLFGVDNMEQAVGECEFALNYNQLAQTVTFEAPVSAIACRVGQVIGVQHELPAWGTGGLLKAGSNKRTIHLDRPVTMESGKTYSVLVHFNSKRYEDINVTRHINDAYTLVSTVEPEANANRIVVDDQDLSIENVVHDDDNNRYLIIVNQAVSYFNSKTAQQYRTDTVETREVETVEGQSTVLMLQGAEDDFSADPQPMMQFSFGEALKQVKKLIVTDISGSGVETRTISGLEYYEEIFDKGLVQNLPSFSSFPKQVREVEDLIVADQVIGNSSDKDLILTASWRYNDENLIQKANVYFSGHADEPLELVGKAVGNVIQIPYLRDYDQAVRIAVVPLDSQGVEVNQYRREITHTVTTFLEIPPPKNIVGTMIRDEITLYWENGDSQYFGDATFRYQIYRSFKEKGQSATFPNDFHLYETTMERFARIEQLQADKDVYFAIVAVNPFRTSQKSSESVYSITTPEAFSNRTSNSGIEIWYSQGVDDGQTLGNPDTHPENWSMEFSSTAVVQAVLTWSNFVFQPWAVTNLASDSVGMNYLGEFGAYPSNPNEGDMFLLSTNNSYYVRRGGAWELFLDRNVSGLSAQYSPNGVQDSSNPDYNWSSSFRPETDRFMRQSTDSGKTWSQSILIVGEKGDGGRYRDYRFTRSIDAPTLNNSELNPTGWFGAPPTGENPIWFIVVEKNSDGTFYDAQWSDPVRLTGIDGKPGDNAIFYKIGYPNGTAIKNGNSSVTLNVRRVDGSKDEAVTSGDHPELYDGASKIGFTRAFGASDINGSKVIQLKYNNVVLDSVTLVDVTDGKDSVYGAISHSNTLSWVRAKNKGNWAPSNKTTDLTVNFYKSGDVVATRVVTAQLNDSTGKVSITGKSSSGEPTTLAIANNNTATPDFTVTHTDSGATASESIHAIEGGEKGDTPDVIQNPDGSVTIIGNNGSADVNKGQDAHSIVLENEGLTIKLDEFDDLSAFPSNSVKIYYGSVDDTANWNIQAEGTGCDGVLTGNTFQLNQLSNKIFAFVTFTATRNGFPTLTKRWHLTTVETVTQIFDPAQIVVTEGHDWVFGNGTLGSFTVSGMTATEGTGTVKLKATSTNPYLQSPKVDVVGNKHYAIVVRLRCISHSLKSVFQVYYRNSVHNHTNDYKSERNVTFRKNEWVTLAFDMRHLTHGDSSDYLDSVIQYFRMDFDSGDNVVNKEFELDYVAIGTIGPADKTDYKDGRIANDKLSVENIKNGASWTILPEDGSTKGAIWNANLIGKPSDAVLKSESFKETFDTLTSAQFEQEFETSSGAGEVSFSTDGAVSGGRFLRIGNNSGNDQRWSISNERFSYDPSKTYILRFRARKVAGSGKAYFGFTGEDKNGNLCNMNGDETHSSQHYFAASSYTLSTEWEEFTAYISGHGATKAEGGAGSTFLDPAKPHPNVRYIRPMFIVNYSNAAGITDIDSITLTEVLANPKATTLETVTDGVEGRFKLKVDGIVQAIDVFTPAERTKLDRLRQGKMPTDASKFLIDTAAAQTLADTAEANAKKIKASPNLLSISEPELAFYNGYTKKNPAVVSTSRGAGDTWRYKHGPMLELARGVSTNTGEQDNFYYKNKISVAAGERYCFQVKIATHRVSFGLYCKIEYKDGTHNYAYKTFSSSSAQSYSDGKTKDRYHLKHLFVDIPANAEAIHPMILMGNATAASTSSYLFVIEWALNRVAAGSNDVPEYSQPSAVDIQDLGFTGAKDANKVEFVTDGTLGRVKYKIDGTVFTYEAVSQSQIDGRANSRIGALRPDSSYKNDRLTSENVRTGAGWSTLPADGANKIEFVNDTTLGRVKYKVNGTTFTYEAVSQAQIDSRANSRISALRPDSSYKNTNTTKADVGLGNVPNWSSTTIRNEAASQANTRIGVLRPDSAYKNDKLTQENIRTGAGWSTMPTSGADKTNYDDERVSNLRISGAVPLHVWDSRGSNVGWTSGTKDSGGQTITFTADKTYNIAIVHIYSNDTEGGHYISINDDKEYNLGHRKGPDGTWEWYSIPVQIPAGAVTIRFFRKTTDGGHYSAVVVTTQGVSDPESILNSRDSYINTKANERVVALRPDSTYKNTNTTKADVGLGNVPNWSATAIRNEAASQANTRIGVLRPDSSYKNDKLTQANIRAGAGWSTLPADGANKTELDGGGAQGQMRVRTNGGSWTNVDVFNATERTQLLRLREGKMPNDSSKFISDTVDAQNRANAVKSELNEDAKRFQAGGGILPDPSFNQLIRGGTSQVTQFFNVHGGNGNSRGYAYVENGNLILRRSNGGTAHDVFELAFKGSNLYIPVQHGERIGCRLDIEGLNGAQSLYVQVVPRDINFAGTSGYHHVITSAQTNALGSNRGVLEGSCEVTDTRTRFYTIRVNIVNAANHAYYRLHSLQLFRLPKTLDNNKLTQTQVKSGAGWSNLPADGANKVEFVADSTLGRVKYKINGTQYNYEAVSQSQIDARANSRIGALRPDSSYKNSNTTKSDVGLSNVPNWSSTTFKNEAVSAAKADNSLHNSTGDGINRFPAIYNNPEEGVPIHAKTRCTVTYTTWDGNGFAGKSAYYMTATSNDAFFMFGKSYSDFNIRLNRGRRWIVSAWVKVNSNHSGKSGQFYFHFKNSEGAGKYNGASFSLPGAYQTKRVSAVIDMTSSTDNRKDARNVQLRFDNEGGNGCIVIIDKIMVEEDVGGKGLPSPYVPPAEPSLVTAKSGLPMTSTVSAAAAVFPVNPLYIGLFETKKVSIRAHTLYMPSGSVSYNAGSISGLKDETRYYVYCSDPYYRGGSVTYYAVEASSIASVTNNPGHRYIGSISTPKSGGGSPSQVSQDAGYPKQNTI